MKQRTYPMRKPCAAPCKLLLLHIPVLLLLLLTGGFAFAQTPVEVINGSGGGPGDPGLQLAFFADGSYRVTKNGLSETYEGPDAPRGIRTYVGFNAAFPPYYGNYEREVTWCYVSPVSGNGTPAQPWTIQLTGNVPTLNNRNCTVILTITYIKDQSYFLLDYIFHFPAADVISSVAHLYLMENGVLGAAGDDAANSECVKGYSSDPSTPEVVGIYRDAACNGKPATRAHVLRMAGGFSSFWASTTGHIHDKIDPVMLDGKLSNISNSSYGFEKAVIVHKVLGNVYNSGGVTFPIIKTARILAGYGATVNDFNGVAGITDPQAALGSTPVTVEFEQPSVSAPEGNSSHPADDLRIRVSGGTVKVPMYVPLALLPGSGPTENQAQAGTDFSYQRGILIPPGAYSGQLLSAGAGVTVHGNTMLEQSPRTMRFRLDNSCRNNLVNISATGQQTATYQIIDDEDRTLTLTLPADLEEGQEADARISLPAGVNANGNITVNIIRKTTSSAAATDVELPATVVIPDGANDAVFKIKAAADKVLEHTEQLDVQADAVVLGVPQTAAGSLPVTDKTYDDPANRALFIQNLPPGGITEPFTGNIRVSLPAGVTTEIPITVALQADAAGTTLSSAEYTLGATPQTFSSGDGLDVPLSIADDDLLELAEQLRITGTVNDDVSRSYTLAATDIPVTDDDYQTDMLLSFTAGATAATEGDAAITFTISLPAGKTAGFDIPLSFTAAGEAAAGDHSALPDAAFMIATGQSGAAFTITALTDDLLEGAEALTLNGSAAGFTIHPYTLTINDKTWEDPANRQLQLALAGGPLKEGGKTALKARFINNIRAGKDIVITLSHRASSAAAASDYTLQQAFITIPAGAREAELPDFFTAQADAVLELEESVGLEGAAAGLPMLEVLPATGSIADATGDDPANKVITVTPAVTIMEEGQSYGLTFSLPPGISTEAPLYLTLQAGPGSTATAADYSLGMIPPLDAAHATVTASISIAADGLLEPEELLQLEGAATGLPGITFFIPPLTLKDEQMTPGSALLLQADRLEITEGGAGAVTTITLPDGRTAGYDIPITIGKGASAAADGEHTPLPVTVTIAQGGNAVTFPQAIVAAADQELEADEPLVITAVAAGFAQSTLTLTLKDATGANPQNRVIRLQPQPPAAGGQLPEGGTRTVRVALPPGITAHSALQVTVSAGGLSAAAAADYSGLPATITIPAGGNGQDISITALTDHILETTELLRLKADVTGMAGITADSLDLFINDLTRTDPANLQLQVTTGATVLPEGGQAPVKIGFVRPGITAAQDIYIDIQPDAVHTANADDYTGLPLKVLLPAGQHQVEHTLQATADNRLEGPETLQFLTTATSGDYPVTPPAAITITESPATVSAIVTTDAAEPAVNGLFTIRLPEGMTPAADLAVTFTTGGTAGSADLLPVGAAAVIPAGSNSITVPVTVQDDRLVEGTKHLSLTLQTAQLQRNGGVSIPVDATPATLALHDDESGDAGRNILIEQVEDATEPATTGAFRIRFSDRAIAAVQDVTVNYAVSGAAAPNTDYTALPGAVTIPAGQNSILLPVSPLDDALVEGAETVQVQLQQAGSNIPGVAFPLSMGGAQAALLLEDDDFLEVGLLAQSSAITEGGAVQVTLHSRAAALQNAPVRIKVTHDAARTVSCSAGAWVNDILTVPLPAGQLETTFSFTVIDNEVSDDDGFLQLEILPHDPAAGTPVYRPGPASAIQVTVTDNDPLTLAFTGPLQDATEGNTAGERELVFSIALNRPSSRPVTLHYGFIALPEDGGIKPAVPMQDFDNTAAPLLIPAGATNISITVPVISDAVFENDEAFGIRLMEATVPSGRHLPAIGHPDTARGIIRNDDNPCSGHCDTDGDGITDEAEDLNGNGDPADDDLDGDGLPNFMDTDSDSDGVPDAVERFTLDQRWRDDNHGNIRVHPAVSPNNDGQGNDALFIENIEKYPVSQVIIFNRWGGTVFKTKGYDNRSNNFRGLANTGGSVGSEVPDGSYFYVIYIWNNGKKEQYTGFIVIKR